MNRTWMWTGAGGLLVGLLVGWWLGRPAVPPPEPPAPSVRQADGSLVVERVAPSTQPQKPPHALPAGSREERRVSVVVKPARGVIFRSSAAALPVTERLMVDAVDEVGRSASSGPAAGSNPAGVNPAADNLIDSCDCPPVQVDLSLVRMPDRTRRVVASSPTGAILSGIDVPLEPEAVPRIPRWTLSAIAVADLEGIRPGALLSRRIGPLVVGAGVLSDPGMRRPGVIGQLGVSW